MFEQSSQIHRWSTHQIFAANRINRLPNSTPHCISENILKIANYKGPASYSSCTINSTRTYDFDLKILPPSCSDITNKARHCDFDGDGVLNLFDLDDDNDGISDAVECPGTSSTSVSFQYQTQTGSLSGSGFQAQTQTLCGIPASTSPVGYVLPIHWNLISYSVASPPVYAHFYEIDASGTKTYVSVAGVGGTGAPNYYLTMAQFDALPAYFEYTIQYSTTTRFGVELLNTGSTSEPYSYAWAWGWYCNDVYKPCDNLALKASISNFVWNDTNENGIQDSGEPGIGGATVQLYAADGVTLIATKTTLSVATDINGDGLLDPVGSYYFGNLDAGTYVVKFITPAGLAPTLSNVTGGGATDSNDSDPDGGSVTVTLGATEQNSTIDAGFKTPSLATLGDKAWIDANGNGIQDGGELALQDVQVSVSDGTNTYNTTTDVNGLWSVSVPPGTYTVSFDAPAGYVSTISNNTTTGTDLTDSDIPAGVNVGTTGSYTVAAGGSDVSIDAGFYIPATISGNVSNGTTGILGVTITLSDGNSETVDPTTTTDGSGNYSFTNVAPGSYTIIETQPVGYTSVSDQDATNDGDPTDGNTTVDNQIGVVVTSGETDNGNNFVEAVATTITISGHIYFEIDGRRDNQVDGTTYIPNGMYAVLVQVNGTSGTVAAVSSVNGYSGLNPGVFSFSGYTNTSYYVYITTTPPVVGATITAPTSVLPSGYLNIDNNVSDPTIGNPLGVGNTSGRGATFTTQNQNVINIDFGIVLAETVHEQ